MSIWAIVWLVLSVIFTIGSIIKTAKAQLEYRKTRTSENTLCTGFGVMVGEDATPGVIVHEKVHLWTLAPWITFAAYNFGWLFFYEDYGLAKSLFIGWFVSCIFVSIPLESIADIGGFVFVGIRPYIREILDRYKKVIRRYENRTFFNLFVAFVLLMELLKYPTWRLALFQWALYERRNERIKERMIDWNEVLRKGNSEDLHP